MSDAVMHAVIDSSRTRGRARTVLLLIAWHARDDAKAFPSEATIAHEAGLDPTSVHRLIAELIEMGELLVEPGKGRRSTTYQVTPRTDTPARPEAASEPAAIRPSVETPLLVNELDDDLPEASEEEEEPLPPLWNAKLNRFPGCLCQLGPNGPDDHLGLGCTWGRAWTFEEMQERIIPPAPQRELPPLYVPKPPPHGQQ